MGTRALRKDYDGALVVEVDDELLDFVEPWRRHRLRFLDALAALTEDDWAAPTRCASWDVRDVVNHLVTVDGFFVASLLAGAAGAPTTYLGQFDPSTTPDALVEPMRSRSPAEVLDQFRTGTDRFVEVVTGLDDGGWDTLAESPMGHVPARLVLAHACWDSWLHERDVLLPLGVDVPVLDVELLVCTWYTLAFGSVQGGLIDDPEPVGPGLVEPIDVVLGFDDLTGDALRLAVDRRVVVERAPGHGTPAGSASALVEATAGRVDAGQPRVPATVRSQLDRARQVL